MKIRKVFLKPIHEDGFHHKSGFCGEIKGIFLVTPKHLTERLCYQVAWRDMEDYVAVSEVENGNYIIVDDNE